MVKKFVPKESKKYPGFYEVPGHPSILIAKDDTICKSATGELLKQHISNWGYKVASVNVVHVIKCLAFNGPVPGYAKMMVNHKDGDKLNNEPDNLEWMTAQENALHAYETGLRDDNTPVLIKDTKDDSVERYYSLWAAAKVLKVNAGTIHKWLRRTDRTANVFRNRYVIIYEGDKWPVITREDLSRVIKGTPVPVIAINLETDEKIIYGNIRDAGRALGLNSATLAVYFSRCAYGESLKFKGYEFVRVEDPDIIRKMRDATFKKLNRGKLRPRKPVPIEVTDLNTNVTTSWVSSEELAKSLGVSKNTLQKGFHAGKGFWRGMKLVYLTK